MPGYNRAMSNPLTIPDPEQLRAEIRAHVQELRAKRRLLKLAEAAEAARQRAAERAALGLAPPLPKRGPTRVQAAVAGAADEQEATR